MTKPTIFWHEMNLPDRKDEISPLGITKFDDDTEVAMFFNHSKNQFVFECAGEYGILVIDDTVAHTHHEE